MSEFSEAFFLRGEALTAGIAFLQDAEVPGYVFPSNNGWIPIASSRGTRLCEYDLTRMLAANPGVLLHYTFAEDHGCVIELYERTLCLGRIRVVFEEGDAQFDREAFVERGLLTEEAVEAIEAWIARVNDDTLRDTADDHFIAQALQLPRYEWLSYEHESANESPDPERVQIDFTGSALDAQGNRIVPAKRISERAPKRSARGAKPRDLQRAG